MKKETKPTFIDKIVRFGAVLLAIALVLGFLAGTFDPRDNKYIAFFGLAYPFLLIINILMILWWCLRKRWIFAISTAVVILIGWRALTATFGIAGESGAGKKANPELFRMMTYNVHSFKPYGSENIEQIKERMLDLIRNEDPDVICFQEYYTRQKGPFDITDSLKQILKTPYYYFEPSSENSYEATGLAIFSKYPIKNKGLIVFGENYGGNASIFIDIKVNNKQLRVYNLHLQSISFDKQDYNYLDKVTKKMDADIVPSKRIISLLKNAFLKRSEQVDIMKKHMGACSSSFLIAGDFNDTPASYAVTQLTRSLNNTFKVHGRGLGRTYNGKFPNFQIDYIATTKDIKVNNYRIIQAKLSDHFPVRSDLSLNP
ncbi:endonuclease/exonuclease/phosphatase family protein [Pedobacter metabolipauper]|uniref:Endonuclease/exonuclease/phosphatase family metal-dependent hydrolase n=1 Tax=Pedobacter metabolipauper TaxID=425513 RepID=A0A4R6SUC4_9SPHI|nr:endonuclease/exonuclease/phosphatase family protein [Pedobacter metabolipauper]TDQ07684.1 endonuclease/exonuclease/phosphatase family metal-dependent hydrolase [Pedobacter metabolipauper]